MASRESRRGAAQGSSLVVRQSGGGPPRAVLRHRYSAGTLLAGTPPGRKPGLHPAGEGVVAFCSVGQYLHPDNSVSGIEIYIVILASII